MTRRPVTPAGGRSWIALVTETYPPEINGVAMPLGRMLEGLSHRGHQIQLVRPRQESDTGTPRSNGIEHALVRGIPIARYDSLKLGLPAGGRLRRLWSERRPDVVHIVTEGPLGWSALSAARDLDLPVTTDFHTNFHSYSNHYGFGWLATGVVAYLRGFHNRAGCTLVPTGCMRSTLAEQGFRDLASASSPTTAKSAPTPIRPTRWRSRIAGAKSPRTRPSTAPVERPME